MLYFEASPGMFWKGHLLQDVVYRNTVLMLRPALSFSLSLSLSVHLALSLSRSLSISLSLYPLLLPPPSRVKRAEQLAQHSSRQQRASAPTLMDIVWRSDGLGYYSFIQTVVGAKAGLYLRLIPRVHRGRSDNDFVQQKIIDRLEVGPRGAGECMLHERACNPSVYTLYIFLGAERRRPSATKVSSNV